MAEDLQNPDNVQAAAGNPAADGEEYEYEYIELAEGEELPEAAEYEYVEVSDDELPSMIPPTAVVSTSDVSEPEVSTPEPIISSAPETVAEPAVNVGISVSRVGSAAQIKAMKQVAGTHRLDLAQYSELADFAQFGSDLDPATKAQIDRGQRPTEILQQPLFFPYTVEDQVQAIYVADKEYLDEITVDEVVDFEHQILAFLHSSHPEIGEDIVKTKKLTDANEEKLKAAIAEFKERYNATKAEKSDKVEG